MCGVAGVFAFDGADDVRVSLERLTTALAHRGPDGCGYHYFGAYSGGFGHRRLSIIDLELGTQPMANEDQTIWLVFNGEIYNHRELRSDLEALGRKFRTRSDTEVIIHGWEEWGVGVLERLNGMYALAVHDTRTGKGEVWLARDPVGIKPLYLGGARGAWWFASELSGARAAGLVSGELSVDALGQYLVYRYVPSPATPYRQTWKVPPGHYCRLVPGEALREPRFVPFRTRFAPHSIPRNAGEWSEALNRGLAQAVRRQLISDVPVGTLLSGGVDSTVVTRLMQLAGVTSPQAFGVGFEEATLPDELAEARAASTALGIDLIEVRTNEEEYLAAWPQQIASLGEPIANSGVLLVGLLCRAVSAHRKVVLTGQGADEPLGGYPRHVVERVYPWIRLLGPALRSLPAWLSGSDQVRRLRRVISQPTEVRRFAEVLAIFTPDEARALVGGNVEVDELIDPVRRSLSDVPHGDGVNRLLAVDARLSLADDLLIVADHMSMASSVELRVPFLDLELLALVERMPSRYKISRFGERKWLYREAVADLLPTRVRSRLTGLRAKTGRKLGFTTPLIPWCRQWTGHGANSFLLSREARVGSWLETGAVASLLSRAQRDPDRYQRQMLTLYVLETWLRSVT